MTLPRAGVAVALFRRVLAGEPFNPADDMTGLLVALQRNNIEQWEYEDVTRDPTVGDAAVAAAKRVIDRLNGNRHTLVEAIDATLADAVDQDATALPTTESPAMVFDRLSVLTIRVHYTERAADEGRDGHAARLVVLQEQVALLEQAVDGMFDDVRAGRRRFVPYQSLKLYGSVATRNGASP